MSTNSDHSPARRQIESAWESWPDRPVPAKSTDIFHFYKWLQFERPDLLIYRDDFVGDEQWQEIKRWLLEYEQGR